MIHLSAKSLTVSIICVVTEASALLLTLHCSNCTVTKSALCFSASDLRLDSTYVTLASDCICCHRSILLLNIVDPRSKVLIQEVGLLKNPSHLVALWDYNSKSPHLTLGGISTIMENSHSSLEDNLSISADAAC